jgi:TonB family protein
MIAEAMLFLLLASLTASLAAWLLASGSGRLGWAGRRWFWLAAVLLGPGLSGLALLRRAGLLQGPANSLAHDTTPIILSQPLEAVTLSIPSAGAPVQAVLAVLWTTSILLCGVMLIRSRRALTKSCRESTRSRLGTREILLSTRVGPAVLGVITPRIILPKWALELPGEHLRLVMVHEEEHIRAKDPAVLTAGLLAVALTPWNPVAWWMLRRLRGSVELDCDDRVLRRFPDRDTYGRSLLAVAERMSSLAPAPLAAFAERPGTLHQRIDAMTTRSNSLRSRLVGASLMLVGAAVGILACDVPDPMTGTTGEILPPEAPPSFDLDGPGDPPLIYVDGVRVDQSALAEFAPDGIERVEVIKGEAAEAAYGPEAASGVVLITLKEAQDEQQEEPTFTPFTQAPTLLNRDEVASALESEYPPLLREAGVEGTVMVWFHIGEDGRVLATRVQETSGHQALDEAALRVADQIEFSPALNRDDPVPVWVALPISFRVR